MVSLIHPMWQHESRDNGDEFHKFSIAFNFRRDLMAESHSQSGFVFDAPLLVPYNTSKGVLRSNMWFLSHYVSVLTADVLSFCKSLIFLL